MKTHFGPWTTAINTGNNPQLSTFWKRRLILLPSLSRVESRMDSRRMCQIGLWGLMLLILPLFRPETAVVAEPPEVKQNPSRIVFWRMHRLASVLPNGGDFQWITQSKNERGVDDPRLSPNGKLLAYGVRKKSDDGIIHGDYPARIHIRRLDEDGEERDLNVEGSIFSWSPDSNKLVVTKLGSGREELPATHFIVEVKSGNSENLNVPGNHLITDWSPDGKSFLTTRVIITDPQKPDDKPKAIISLVGRDGGGVRSVSRPEQLAFFGRFSPDGKMVLYTTRDPNDLKSMKSSLWVTSLADGKSRKVTLGLNEEIMGACWSPDGKQIAYIWRTVHENGKTDLETESFLDVIGLDGNYVKTLLSEKVGPRKGARWIITLGSPDWR